MWGVGSGFLKLDWELIILLKTTTEINVVLDQNIASNKINEAESEAI